MGFLITLYIVVEFFKKQFHSISRKGSHNANLYKHTNLKVGNSFTPSLPVSLPSNQMRFVAKSNPHIDKLSSALQRRPFTGRNAHPYLRLLFTCQKLLLNEKTTLKSTYQIPGLSISLPNYPSVHRSSAGIKQTEHDPKTITVYKYIPLISQCFYLTKKTSASRSTKHRFHVLQHTPSNGPHNLFLISISIRFSKHHPSHTGISDRNKR